MRIPKKKKKPNGYWSNMESNRKQFLYDFAEKHRFDPHIPDNWRGVTALQIEAHNVSSVLPSDNDFLSHHIRVADCSLYTKGR